MNKPIPLPDDEEAFEAWPGEEVEPDAHDLAAIADIEAGRFVPHEAVARWLKSWGTENELPPPQCRD